MKRKFLFIHNQGGFILPYTLFVVAIVLLCLTTQIHTYKNDIQITQNHQKQIRIETLVQMGREAFKQEIALTRDQSGTTRYHFPPGDVSIDYQLKEKKHYTLIWHVTANDKTYQSVTNLSLDDIPEQNEKKSAFKVETKMD